MRSLMSKNNKVSIAFSDIIQLKIYAQWINEVLLPILYYNNERSILNQNYIIGDPEVLFGIRYVKPSKNSDNQTNAVFVENIPGYEYSIFDTIGDELDKDPIILSTGKSYNYIGQGDYSTFYGCGGFLFPYPRDKDLAFKMNYLKEYTVFDVV